MKRALSEKERDTRKHAAYAFLDIGVAFLLVFHSGMDEVLDWILVGGYVLMFVGNVWVVTDNIKAALKAEQADA